MDHCQHKKRVGPEELRPAHRCLGTCRACNQNKNVKCSSADDEFDPEKATQETNKLDAQNKDISLTKENNILTRKKKERRNIKRQMILMITKVVRIRIGRKPSSNFHH